jgi:hypothetical protein
VDEPSTGGISDHFSELQMPRGQQAPGALWQSLPSNNRRVINARVPTTMSPSGLCERPEPDHALPSDPSGERSRRQDWLWHGFESSPVSRMAGVRYCEFQAPPRSFWTEGAAFERTSPHRGNAKVSEYCYRVPMRPPRPLALVPASGAAFGGCGGPRGRRLYLGVTN